MQSERQSGFNSSSPHLEGTNPYVVLAWASTALTAAVLTYHPYYQALLFLVLLNTGHAVGLKLDEILKVALIVSLPLTLINIFFNHLGENVVWNIPNEIVLGLFHLPLPLVGGPITAESLVYAVIVSAMIANTILIFTIFQRRVSPDCLLAMMPERLPKLALTLAVVFRFIPLISENYHSVSEAQIVRGANLKSGGVYRRTITHFRILKPVVINTFERAHNLSESLAARAYSGKRTVYNKIKWGGIDRIEAGLYLAVFTILVSCKIFGVFTYWPYGNLMPLPPYAPAIACILLLGLPAKTMREAVL